MIVIEPIVIQWMLISAASFAAFMIGKSWNRMTTDQAIEKTIMYMVNNNLVRFKRDENGEIELLPLDEK
jgi:hypothetical protein